MGVIFNIQRYCLHDGPGIRTTVFLKGCPLACPWCSNPESIHPDPEIIYDRRRCRLCGTCSQVCPAGAIKSVDGALSIAREFCNQCGICVQQCPSGALRMMGQHLTVDDVMQTVRKDMSFYRRSRGGVTISGGEPALQQDFLIGLLQALRSEKIHTAIETSGFQRWNMLSNIIEQIDLVYYDLKIIDNRMHKSALGASNLPILENAARISKHHPAKVIFRIPVIPTYTDSDENIRGIARFLTGIDYRGYIELIPYHRYGESKYSLLGREYRLKGINPLGTDPLQSASRTVEKEGFSVRVSN